MRLDVGARDGGVEGVRQLIEGTRLKRQAGEEKGADSSNMPACQHASKEPSECMGGGARCSECAQCRAQPAGSAARDLKG